jgi:hypothetical protein
LHYNSKEELFSSCHGNIVSEFHFGPFHPLSQDELLAPEAPTGIIFAYKHLEESRVRLNSVFQGRDGQLILRRIRDTSAEQIENNLRTVFTETDSTIPFNMLANYLAGAQVALMQWWLEKRHPYTAENLAQTFHSLQRAAIRDALGLSDALKT